MSSMSHQLKIQTIIFMIFAIHNQYLGLYVLDYLNCINITITARLHSYLKMYLHVAIAYNNRWIYKFEVKHIILIQQ